MMVLSLKQGTAQYVYILAEMSRQIKQNDCVTNIFPLFFFFSGRKEGRTGCSGILKAEAGGYG